MPLAGDRPELALALAADMLAGESAAGTIVFMTDGIDQGLAGRFAGTLADSGDQLLLLAFGTDAGGLVAGGGTGDIAPPVNKAGLRRVAREAGGAVIDASVDDSDVASLDRRVQRHLVNAIESDEDLRWHDAGYYLVWPLALLALAWFRRGWTVQWQ